MPEDNGCPPSAPTYALLPMKDLLECTALITGASSGIGAEIARQLAPLAERLILVARREDRLIDLARELKSINPAVTIEIKVADLAQLSEAESLCDWVFEQGFALDLLINNAGVGDHGPFESADWNRVEEMLGVNISALTYLSHRLVPLLRRNRPGAILNISSMASLLPIPGMGVYAATKAYVSSFSEALRAELRGSGVGVTHVCPGPVKTEFGRVAKRRGTAGFADATSDLLDVAVEDVAREALRAVVRDSARVFPGVLIKVAAIALAVIPLFVLRLGFERRVEQMRPRSARDTSYASDIDAESDLS